MLHCPVPLVASRLLARAHHLALLLLLLLPAAPSVSAIALHVTHGCCHCPLGVQACALGCCCCCKGGVRLLLLL
jgi:hypothetical protein